METTHSLGDEDCRFVGPIISIMINLWEKNWTQKELWLSIHENVSKIYFFI